MYYLKAQKSTESTAKIATPSTGSKLVKRFWINIPGPPDDGYTGYVKGIKLESKKDDNIILILEVKVREMDAINLYAKYLLSPDEPPEMIKNGK